MKQLSLVQFICIAIATLLVSHGLIAEQDRDAVASAAEQAVAAVAAIAAVIIRHRQQRIRTETALQLPPTATHGDLECAIDTAFAQFGFLGGLKRALGSKPVEVAREVVRVALPQAAPVVDAIDRVAQGTKEKQEGDARAPRADEIVRLRRAQDRLRVVIGYMDQRVTRLEDLVRTWPQPKQEEHEP